MPGPFLRNGIALKNRATVPRPHTQPGQRCLALTRLLDMHQLQLPSTPGTSVASHVGKAAGRLMLGQARYKATCRLSCNLGSLVIILSCIPWLLNIVISKPNRVLPNVCLYQTHTSLCSAHIRLVGVGVLAPWLHKKFHIVWQYGLFLSGLGHVLVSDLAMCTQTDTRTGCLANKNRLTQVTSMIASCHITWVTLSHRDLMHSDLFYKSEVLHQLDCGHTLASVWPCVWIWWDSSQSESELVSLLHFICLREL